MTVHHPEWTERQRGRAVQLSRTGTPLVRIAEEFDLPLGVLASRIREARQRPEPVPAGMAECWDEYMAFIGID